MDRIWMAAAVPCVLMALMFFGFWAMPSWSNTVSPLTCVLVLAGALVTGLCVLILVFAGWMRGAYTLRRGDILAATVFASLDVLVPLTLAALLWLVLQGLKNSRGILTF